MWRVCLLALIVGCDGGDPVVDAAAVDGATIDAAIDAPAAIDAAEVDAGPQVCAPTAIDGTFEGVAYRPIQRASVARDAEGLDVMLLRESAGAACDTGPAIERFLTLAFACPPIVAGTYPVRPSLGSACPAEGPGVLVLVQTDGGFVHGIASAGEVVITSVAGGCITGTFTTTFDNGDTLTGQLGALHCP